MLLYFIGQGTIHNQRSNSTGPGGAEYKGFLPRCGIDRYGIGLLAFICRKFRPAVGQSLICLIQSGLVLLRKVHLESWNNRSFWKDSVSKVMKLTIVSVCDYSAGFLKRNGSVVVFSAGSGVNKCRACERFVSAVEVTGERKVDNGFGLVVQIDCDVSFARISGPYSPYAARPFHLGKHEFTMLSANPAGAAKSVTVGFPIYIFSGFFVITAFPVIAGPLHAALALGG